MADKRNQLPCLTKLRLLLSYEKDSGLLRWNLSARRGYVPGDVAGSLGKYSGYRLVALEGKAYYAHRIIWKLMTGEEPPRHIDHVDGDQSNNVWENLRAASPVTNGYNRRIYKNNRSGVKGVHWDADAGKWRAVITVNKRAIGLGRFAAVPEAAAAIAVARHGLHGDFARFS